jgi:hypothetical protein
VDIRIAASLMLLVSAFMTKSPVEMVLQDARDFDHGVLEINCANNKQ